MKETLYDLLGERSTLDPKVFSEKITSAIVSILLLNKDIYISFYNKQQEQIIRDTFACDFSKMSDLDIIEYTDIANTKYIESKILHRKNIGQRVAQALNEATLQ